MATKLKNMRLTSVDLVRAGANQEADICLFKSADTETPPEATGSPTEPEKNILKRFIAWLEKNPTEAENEPHSPQDTRSRQKGFDGSRSNDTYCRSDRRTDPSNI